MINDMIGNIRGAIGQMEGLRYSLVKLPKSARKNLLMDAMDDYLAELNNTLSNMDQSNKVVAANLLNAFEDNKAERERVREQKREYWGFYQFGTKPVNNWDLAMDWVTMTNDLFYQKYEFSWTPSIKLQDEVKAFLNKYGNITEDDLKKPYGATGRDKAPLQGESCMTKRLNPETTRKFTEDRMDTMKYIADSFVLKERPSELTRNQLNTLGGLNSPNYNLYG